jgi:hypothetical protein
LQDFISKLQGSSKKNTSSKQETNEIKVFDGKFLRTFISINSFNKKPSNLIIRNKDGHLNPLPILSNTDISIPIKKLGSSQKKNLLDPTSKLKLHILNSEKIRSNKKPFIQIGEERVTKIKNNSSKNILPTSSSTQINQYNQFLFNNFKDNYNKNINFLKTDNRPFKIRSRLQKENRNDYINSITPDKKKIANSIDKKYGLKINNSKIFKMNKKYKIFSVK